MLAITQPALTGITAQAASASTQVTSGASRNTPLLAPAGMIGSLSTNFSRSAKLCSKPHGPDHVGAAPDLHRRPDLAVGEEHIGDRDQQDHEHQDAFRDHDDQRPDVIGPKLGHAHWSYPGPLVLLGRRGRGFGERRALGHHRGGARDRIGEIEVLDRRAERRPVEAAAQRREFPHVVGARRRDRRRPRRGGDTP